MNEPHGQRMMNELYNVGASKVRRLLHFN